jgi:hypothetical protein
VNGNEGASTGGRYRDGSSHAQGRGNDEQSVIGTSAAQDLGPAPEAVGQLAAAGRPVRVGLKRGHGRGGHLPWGRHDFDSNHVLRIRVPNLELGTRPHLVPVCSGPGAGTAQPLPSIEPDVWSLGRTPTGFRKPFA